MAQVLEFLGLDSDLDWIRAQREKSSIPNQSKADVDKPPYVRYYLSRRYLDRTKMFNAMTEGLVQDWVDDMEQCVAKGSRWWEVRYRLRSAVRYQPIQWAHRLVDPVRTWWKVRRARQELSRTITNVG